MDKNSLVHDCEEERSMLGSYSIIIVVIQAVMMVVAFR